MKQDIPLNEFLVEMNQDLSIPLEFKVSLREFYREAYMAVLEDMQSRERVRALWEAAPVPSATDYINKFMALPKALPVDHIHVLSRELSPSKHVPPSGLIKAFMNFLGSNIDNWLDKKIPSWADSPKWIKKLQTKLHPHAYYKLQQIASLGGKIAPLVYVVAAAIGTVYSLPVVSAGVAGAVAATGLKLLADLLSGVKTSTAIRSAGTNLVAGITLGAAISYLDSSFPSIREFISDNWQRLGISQAQASQIADATSLDAGHSPASAGDTSVPTPQPGLDAGHSPESAGDTSVPTPQPGLDAGHSPESAGDTSVPTPQPGLDAGHSPESAGDTSVGAGRPAITPAELSTGANQLHNIKAGETLSGIAQKYNMSVGDLMAANPQLSDPNKIIAGAQVIIPPETGKSVYAGGVGLPGRR